MQNKYVPYTPEQSKEIITRYAAGDSIESISKDLGRSSRSIIAKLVHDKVYKSKTKLPIRLTKAALVVNIADMLNITVESIETLESATHDSLLTLNEAVLVLYNTSIVLLEPIPV